MSQNLLTDQLPDTSKGTGPLELGVRMVSDVPGQITAIRFWKLVGDPDVHIGVIWKPEGDLITSARFMAPSASGWQQANLLEPLSILPNVVYVVSVTAVQHFAVKSSGMPLVNDHLKATASCYGPVGTFPTSPSPHNYFRDIVFVPDPPEASRVTLEQPADPDTETLVPFAGTLETEGMDPGEHVLSVGVDHQAPVSVTVTVPTPETGRLIQREMLKYAGAMRVPGLYPIGGSSFGYGGTAFTWDPVTKTCLMVGHDYQQQVVEITLPPAFIADTLSGLAYVRVDRGFVDVLDQRLDAPAAVVAMLRQVLTEQLGTPLIGQYDPDVAQAALEAAHARVQQEGQPLMGVEAGSHRGEAREGMATAAKIGGMLPLPNGRLLVSIFLYYDGSGLGTVTWYTTDRDLSGKNIEGPFRSDWGPGVTGGYLARVPQALQAELGGPVVCGQAGLSIISRSSCGPALFALNPADLTLVGRTPVLPLLYYPTDHQLDTASPSPLFNMTSSFTGCIIPEGYRSVLFFGKHGLGPYCYGEGTDCGDPAVASKGGHAYPYAPYVWAYDVSDLAAVRRGERPTWSVRPYAVWKLDLPFGSPTGRVSGATYDAEGGRILLTAAQTWTPQGDSDRPLIHALTLEK